MRENQPLKAIPLPNYNQYKFDLCNLHNLSWPLKSVGGNLMQIPPPLNEQKKGWPWDKESATRFWGMDDPPKLSVVIPSYQQGIFIEETIRSILLQNYPNLEIIIIDGGSTDETTAVLYHYKNFISAYLSEQDRGQAHAVNKGFSLASGDIYYWVNSDDFLNMESFNIAIPFFINNPHLDIIYGDGLTFDEGTKQLNYTEAPWVRERYLRFGSIVLSHSVMWRSKIHCPLWEDLHCAMDAELWLRLFKNRRFRHINFPIGTLRVHPNQKTSNMQVWEEKWKEDYQKFIWEWYPSIDLEIWKWRTREFRLVQKVYRSLNFKRELKKSYFNRLINS